MIIISLNILMFWGYHYEQKFRYEFLTFLYNTFLTFSGI